MPSSVGTDTTAKAAAKLEAIEAINREPSFTPQVKQALIEAYIEEDICVEGAQSTQLSFIVGSRSNAPTEAQSESEVARKREAIAAIYQDTSLSPKEKHSKVQALVAQQQPTYAPNNAASSRGRAVQEIYKDDSLSPRAKLAMVQALMEGNSSPNPNRSSRLASAMSKRNRPRPTVDFIQMSKNQQDDSVADDSVSRLENQETYFRDEFSKGSSQTKSQGSKHGTRTYGSRGAKSKALTWATKKMTSEDSVSDVSDGGESNKKLYIMLFCAVVFFWAVVGPLLGAYWDEITGNAETTGGVGGNDASSTFSPTAFTTQPPTAVVYDEPSANQCTRISQGNSVFGQEEMQLKAFRLDVDVSLYLPTDDVAPLMDSVTEAMQRILAPSLAGCESLEVSAQGVRGRRLVSDYVVGNAKMYPVAGSNGDCAPDVRGACFRMTVRAELLMKGYETNLRVINHINSIFGKNNLFKVLQLESPYEDVMVVSVVPTADTTDAPTGTPSVVPTIAPTIVATLSPTRSPTKFPTGRPTPPPTPWPTNRPTPPPTRTPAPTVSRRSHIEQSLRNVALTNVDAYDWLFNADYWVPSGWNPSDGGDFWMDRYVLMTLYFNTDGGEWAIRNGWGASTDHCTWYGIACDSSRRVHTIQLRSNEIIGSFPNEIMALTNLQTLDLYANALTGTVPTEIGSMTDLRVLNLGNLGLTGSLPPRIGNLSNLRLFDLSDNAISSSIPTQVGRMTSLRSFFMPNNQLTGELPTQFRQSKSMEYLDISNNQLEGSIPRRIFAMTNLIFVGLANNNFQYNIPSEINALTRLQILRLDGNQLSGFIPVLPQSLIDCTLAGNNFSEDSYALLQNCRVE